MRFGFRTILGVTLLAGVCWVTDSLEAGIATVERDALVALYNSADGANWTDNTGWLGAAGTECDWFGVTCDEGRTTVEQLSLFNNQLSGTIPPELGGLPNLRVLGLNSNQLEGAIPSALGGLNSLQSLFLNHNQLSGSIPPELGGAAELRSMTLHGNQLSGAIPPELGNLSKLAFLLANNNQLEGEIPPELGNLEKLDQLYLGRNQLTGNLPSSLGSLDDLRLLLLEDNQLTGSIPPELAGLTSLVRLDLSENDLTGSIPPGLGALASLEELLLDGNELTGPIPPELGSLTNLGDLNLRDNNLEGEIPPALGQLASLLYLNLSFNHLTGEIPPELGDLSNLLVFQLSNNQLEGLIPPELGNLSSVTVLSLISNQLTGGIPPELGDLSGLIALVLSHNRLSGPVPPEVGDMASLESLSLSSNQLTGALPEEILGLTNLFSIEFRWNGLYADDEELRLFLDSLQNWRSTQTVAPENVTAMALPRSVLVRWSPVSFTEEAGRFLVSAGTSPQGPFQWLASTENKLTTELEIRGLTPGKEYFFVVQSQTDPHSNNGNTVTSDFSPPVSVTTTPLAWVYGPGNPEGGLARFDGLALTNFSNAQALLDLEAIPWELSKASFGRMSLQGDDNLANVVLAAGEQRALLRSDLFQTDPDAPAWVELVSDTPQIGTFFQFGTDTLSQLDGGVAVTETTLAPVLTRVFDGPGAFRGQAATTRISILNPGDDPVTIELSYRPPGQEGAEGQGSSPLIRIIGARSFLDAGAGDLFPGGPAGLPSGGQLSGGVIAGKVTEGAGVVAFQVVQLTDQTTVLGLNAATGNSTHRAYSAQLASQPGLFTSVNVVNLSSQQRSVLLRAVREDGTSQGEAVEQVLGPGEQFTEDAGVLFGGAGSGPHPAQGESFVGSLIVESNGEGVVGDVIFGDSVNLAYAASLPLQTRAFTEALFNQVANVSGFFTGLAFFYPGPTGESLPQGPANDAEITVQVFLPGGDMVGESTVILGPGERVSQLVEQLVGEIELAGGYVRVFSTEEIIGQMLFGVVGPGGIRLFSAVPPTVVQ